MRGGKSILGSGNSLFRDFVEFEQGVREYGIYRELKNQYSWSDESKNMV